MHLVNRAIIPAMFTSKGSNGLIKCKSTLKTTFSLSVQGIIIINDILGAD